MVALQQRIVEDNRERAPPGDRAPEAVYQPRDGRGGAAREPIAKCE
jgi:hypothetical protein